ncbi:MAG: putative sugar nucleotidyl transferase [Gemmataceae bacterium]
MRVCLYEDRGAAGLEPLTTTRPVFDLFCGATSLADKQLAAFPDADAGLLVRADLADLVRLARPGVPVNDLPWLAAGPVVLVNGRWLPPTTLPALPDGPCVGLADGTVVFATVTPSQLPDDWTDFDNWLLQLRDELPTIDAGGVAIRHLWELISANPEHLNRDFAKRSAPRIGPWPLLGCRPEGVGLIGPSERLLIDPEATVDPMVLFDTTRGSIVVDAGACVQAFSRVEGPCYIGVDCQILGAKLRGGVTLGPGCRIGGEVECSIVQGYTNKYHEGFLGHSYVGEWVNFGAGAQASDLRNDYGEVRVILGGSTLATGTTKVGALVGDHAKIGLGCLLNTGTVIGAFGQTLPAGRLLPKHVPPYGTTRFDRVAERDDLDGMLTTAATVMTRRGHELTPAHLTFYRRLHASTAGARRAAVREAERRRLARAA